MRTPQTPAYVLALDQGTTSSRAILFDQAGQVVSLAQEELKTIYPRPGWVEQDPDEIFGSQLRTAHAAIARAGVKPNQIAAIGVTNQRETTIVWDRRTGKPIANAIVWQCRRTADMCAQLAAGTRAQEIRHRTGLVIDPYFSATKVRWILDNVSGARAHAENGDLLFGTVDSWLIYRLTGGRIHVTDVSNASRTMLFNIRTLDWDQDILDELRIPRAMLPQAHLSSETYGLTDPAIFGSATPIAASVGDQQSALFGQACFARGMAKNTYGTGCFLLINAGQAPVSSRHGLLTTIAWGLPGGPTYALEGSVFIAGAAVQWLRDQLWLIASAAESELLARQVPDTGGVYLVPAFVGLGAPHWDPTARGVVVGLTRGTSREHIVRAALESMAYQTLDVLRAMEEDLGESVPELRVDGGAAVNDFLMQFQADVLNAPVVRPKVVETTALGAAYLAGLAVGLWSGTDELALRWAQERRFEPNMDERQRAHLTQGWARAVARARNWES